MPLKALTPEVKKLSVSAKRIELETSSWDYFHRLSRPGAGLEERLLCPRRGQSILLLATPSDCKPVMDG